MSSNCAPCDTDFDANNIFKAFFGGPGGFSFEGKCLSHLCKTVRNHITIVYYIFQFIREVTSL